MSEDNAIEKNLIELEKIVKDLELGSLSLDESLKKFEVGVELYRSCKNKLEMAEKKIKVLTDKLSEIPYTQD